MNLGAIVEGVLFYRSEPMTVTELAHVCETDVSTLEEALVALTETLAGRGVTLVREGEMIGMMTATGVAETIEKMRKEELKRDIGKAGAETLAIIAYHESVTRAEIDFIRGVNSTFILRNLMIRGLIERIQNPKDQRSFAYRPTLELYAHLGIARKEDLPQYAEMMEEIEKYRSEQKDKELETV